MVSESHESDAKILQGLEFSRLKDSGTDLLDVFCCRSDVCTLAASAVLDEDQIPRTMTSVRKQSRFKSRTASCGRPNRSLGSKIAGPGS